MVLQAGLHSVAVAACIARQRLLEWGERPCAADRMSNPAPLRELARLAVLVLDDFPMRELTPAHADDIYELINDRAG